MYVTAALGGTFKTTGPPANSTGVTDMQAQRQELIEAAISVAACEDAEALDKQLEAVAAALENLLAEVRKDK
jgi:hypothetical protein